MNSLSENFAFAWNCATVGLKTVANEAKDPCPLADYENHSNSVDLDGRVGIALGQGSVVNFNNNVLTDGDHKVYFDFVGNGADVVGTNYVAELYYADPATSALTPFATSISKFRVTTTTSPGTWSGKTVTLPIGGVDVPITLEVRVWDAGGPGNGIAGYDSYDQAVVARLSGVNTFTAESCPFSFTQAGGTPPPDDATFMVNLPAFGPSLVPCPEPSVIPLGFGAMAALLVLCRRK
jgi:hypothetical protein